MRFLISLNKFKLKHNLLFKKTEQGQHSVTEGNKLISQTTDSFEQISTTTTKNAEQLNHLLTETDLIRSQVNYLLSELNEITAISQQSASSTMRINQSGEQQTMMMKDIYAASKELATIAEKLQLSIERFES